MQKFALVATENGEELQPMETGDFVKLSDSEKMILDLFFRCPITHEAQIVFSVLGSEEGIRDGLEIHTRGESTAWKHTINTEEICVPHL